MVPGRGREPALLIVPKCRLFRQALGGGFFKSTLPPYKPKKTHPWGDLVDAARYGIDNLDSMRRGEDARLRRLAEQDIVETRA
jgi:hypothetical protein